MISFVPFSGPTAFAVFRQLDPADWHEAQAVRGGGADHLDLWADWRAMQGSAILSYVIRDDSRATAFGVIALGHTGQAGVAQAAFLSRCHRTFRREIVEVARQIREELPVMCDTLGIHRVEVRCWAEHPTAAQFLASLGFRFEATLDGFGHNGRARFHQFAYLGTET